MARIHVFAIDWVPDATDITSGGGLRSLQVIAALRRANHDVSFSVPAESRTVRGLRLTAPDRLRTVEVHDSENQIEVLRRARPDVVLWLWPAVRAIPLNGLGDMVHICDLNGLQDHEGANGTPGLLATARARVLGGVRGAAAVLTGSPEQYGYWLAQLGDEGPAVALAGYALPPDLQGKVVSTGTKLRALHFTGNVYSWSASTALLRRCAAWAERDGSVELHLLGGTDPGGATGLDDIRALRDLVTSPAVQSHSEMGFSSAMALYQPGCFALDLNDPTVERSLAVPIRTVNAMMHGVPIVSTLHTPLLRRMERAGAAVLVPQGVADGLERSLDELSACPAATIATMALAARAFAVREFDFAEAADSIAQTVDRALSRHRSGTQGWRTGAAAPPGIEHVLVISGEPANLRALRVELPFATLHRRRLIGGYTIWHNGRVVESTRRDTATLSFDAIWIHRSVSAEIALLMDSLDLPYVYDIDDNLLVSPKYRDAFTPESLQCARHFVRAAAVLSCSTARLATLLQRLAGVPVVQKTMVTPNMLRLPPPARPVGRPTCVIWASSDVPALTDDRLAVVKAVRDFCLSHQMRLVCIGAAPHSLLLESGVEVEHIGLQPYHAYLDLLRSLAPAILVGPLETGPDDSTRRFVDGKSDIKMLEALAAGIVGVFSAAPAYLDSDLPTPILCDNTYRGWLEGLLRAATLCEAPSETPLVTPTRLAGELGVRPYFEALRVARLPHPLHLATLADRLASLRGRLVRRQLGREDFDEAFYLAKYPDVRAALERGTITSAYHHYINTGFVEHREGREGDHGQREGEQWWANLMHTVGDLATVIASRAEQIEDLKARRTIRLRLEQQKHA